jgi:hypothetical protein
MAKRTGPPHEVFAFFSFVYRDFVLHYFCRLSHREGEAMPCFKERSEEEGRMI